MEAYTRFADVYDIFMDEIPYDRWAEYITGILKEYKITQTAQIVELGCGTGSFTMEMARRGYRMTGIDNSQEMLSIASDKLYEEWDDGSDEPDIPIIYTLQDMANFSVACNVDAVISVCDSMNYLTDSEQLYGALKASFEALVSGGVLLFDMKKDSFYREVLAQNTFADTRDECAYIWNNYYDESTGLNEYELTLFIENEDGRYSRYDEHHIQRAYNSSYVYELLQNAGFADITIREASDEEQCERIYYSAVKP